MAVIRLATGEQLEELEGDVQAAQSAADSAQSSADEAQSAAESAASDASDAHARADTAWNLANSAHTRIDTLSDTVDELEGGAGEWPWTNLEDEGNEGDAQLRVARSGRTVYIETRNAGQVVSAGSSWDLPDWAAPGISIRRQVWLIEQDTGTPALAKLRIGGSINSPLEFDGLSDGSDMGSGDWLLAGLSLQYRATPSEELQ